MDAAAISTMISSVGFPIAMCIILFYFYEKETEAHKQETNSLKDAINNNTLVIQKLIDRLEADNVSKADHNR